jgi:CHASE2 domain-containing sensor protein
MPADHPGSYIPKRRRPRRAARKKAQYKQRRPKPKPHTKTVFFGYIAHSTKVFWGSAEFESDEDMVVRRWRLWEAPCDHRGAAPIPSIELLAAALIKPDQPSVLAEDPRVASDYLLQLLGSVSACSGSSPYTQSPDSATATPNRTVVRRLVEGQAVDRRDRLIRRVVYSMPWQPPPGHTAIARQAMELVEAPVHDHRAFNGQIVVIGGSFEDSGDIHPTPLGPMPGALALINAIVSLEDYGEVERMPRWLDLLFEIVLVVLMSVAFLFLPPFFAMLASSVLIFALYVPLSLELFEHGVWLDFIIPLLAVQLHELTARLEEAFERRHGPPNQPSKGKEGNGA